MPKSIPGPVKVNPTGRTVKHVDKLNNKIAHTDEEIKRALDEKVCSKINFAFYFLLKF